MKSISVKKLKITIGVAAYNEEANIGKLLQNVISQKHERINIVEILVYSDGSTDETVKVAQSVRDKRIRVIADKKRRGKAFRLNALFREAKGEVIVLFDADYVPTQKNTIELICAPFHNPSFKGLAGGRRKAVPSSSLTARGLANLFHAFDIVRRELHGGKSIYSFLAGITALHRDFAKTLSLPLDSPCDDNHIYLEAKKRNLGLAYVPAAAVWFSPPQTIFDQISQGSRYLASEDILSRYFEYTFVADEFFIPLGLCLKVLSYQLKKDSLAYLWIKSISIICRVRAKRLASHYGGKWRAAMSTKKTI